MCQAFLSRLVELRGEERDDGFGGIFLPRTRCRAQGLDNPPGYSIQTPGLLIGNNIVRFLRQGGQVRSPKTRNTNSIWVAQSGDSKKNRAPHGPGSCFFLSFGPYPRACGRFSFSSVFWCVCEQVPRRHGFCSPAFDGSFHRLAAGMAFSITQQPEPVGAGRGQHCKWAKFSVLSRGRQ